MSDVGILNIDFNYLTATARDYDINTMFRNPLIQRYGLGAIVGILPQVDPPSDIKPETKGNINTDSMATFTVVNGFAQSFIAYIYKESSKFVLLNQVTELGTILSIKDTEQQYRRTKKHYGKFSTKSDAQEWSRYLMLKSQRATEIASNSLAQYNFGPYITTFDVSYSMDGANQIQFTVIDPDYKFMELNYFQARRELAYRGEIFEIGAIEVGNGPGGSPQVTITAWNGAVQKMKREKNPRSISGGNVYDYALNVANKYGLRFVGERPNKHQTINKSVGNGADESVWTALTGSASSAEFSLFVMDNTLFYASQKWLLWKYGVDSRFYTKDDKQIFQYYSKLYYDPSRDMVGDETRFPLVGWPTIRQSENDPREGDGSASVARPNGCVLRPGHTVLVGPKPTLFNNGYLVSEVSFSEGSTDPVSVTFRTPLKTSDEIKRENRLYES